MIQHAPARKLSSPSLTTPQPSQLWTRRMGTKAETQRGETFASATNYTPSFTRVAVERAPPFSIIPTAATTFDLRAAPTPLFSSPLSATLPRSSTLGELKLLTPLSTKTPWSHTFLSDIWSPRDSDNLVSPISVGTPILSNPRSPSRPSTPIKIPQSLPLAKSVGHTPTSSMSAMDKDNMAVAVQVALQIIEQDGAYDSDDEQYCRQALHWLQDPSLDNDERGVFQSGHGRARSKTDADHFMIRDDRCRAGVDGEAIDDEQPKRKGRARMSQEKRRRLARRKEREALILLGLPPIPSSAPAHTSSFRLPPLITNTLANVASSNLSPEDRAAAVEAARVLVASSGFFNQNFRMPQRFPTKAASSEILERRQGSVPNLRSTQSAFCSESSHYTFPSSPEGIDSAFARFHMGDPSGISDYRPRTMTSTSSSSASNRLSSSFGMPSLSRGGSVASSLASTPLQTPDNFAVPLPPTTFPGENICPADARDTSLPFSKNTMGGMNPVGSFGGCLPYHFSHTMSLLTVPNVCVMPPTPHSKATQQNLLSLKHAAKDTQSGIESALPRKDSILNFGSDDVFPSLAAAASRSSKGAKTASMGPKAGFGAIGPPKVTDPSSQGTTTLPAWAAPSRRHSNTSMQSSSGASSSSGSASENHTLHDSCYFNMMSSANSGSGLCPAYDAIARVEAKWRESHAPFRHDSQLAQTSKHLSIPQGGMQVSGLSSAADRPMGSLGPASSNFSSSASFRPHRHLSMNSVGSPSENTRLSPSASSFNFNGGFDFGSHAGFGLPGTASPTFAHHGNQLPAPSSALGLDFDMGGPLDCRSA